MAKQLCSIVLFVLILPVTANASGISVRFTNPEEFDDFGLHEEQSVEDAVIIMERELQQYWDRRLKKELPDGWGLELSFTEIDLAGQMEPWHDPTFELKRFYAERFPPRMEFDYRITDADGSLVEEGSAKVLDKHYTFGGSGKMVRGEFAFGYELEALRKWLEAKGAAFKQ